jgi:UDP-N-acetyl-D-galactosamine dehydrogenase
VVDAGVHRASCIKVAEAAKVIENSQRDINIAFMNELSIIFNKLGIDTKSVLEAAGTKWNFLKFYPGLVGGHCIGVDPYYLTYKAEQMGYHSQVILAGRRINDDMGRYVAENVVKSLIKAEKAVKGAKVAILGFTFKENCPDTRNTKVFDIIQELREYGIEPIVADPEADAEEALRFYGIKLTPVEEIRDMDAVVLSVVSARPAICFMVGLTVRRCGHIAIGYGEAPLPAAHLHHIDAPAPGAHRGRDRRKALIRGQGQRDGLPRVRRLCAR